MNDVWKLLGQGLGVFTVTFGIFFWILEGAPLPYIGIKAKSLEPDARVPVFQPVENRLGHPEYLQEDEPEKPAQGDENLRRTKYRTALMEAIEAVEADHCAMPQKKILAVAVTAYLQAQRDDQACALCFWGKTDEEITRDWSTPLDKKLKMRLNELMLHRHLTREDFKNPPVLIGLGSRNNSQNSC